MAGTDRARMVCQVTGDLHVPGGGGTAAWDVYGTDLGHVFEHQGRYWMVLGDTFGPGKGHWRSNAMAEVSISADSVQVIDMASDRRGRARELLISRKGAGEVTVIPTGAVSTGSAMVLHYMSVRAWGAPGVWTANYAGLAHSNDGGRHWSQPRRSRWPGDSNFVQVAFVLEGGVDHHAPGGTDAPMLHVYGIPAGRMGGAALARVPRDRASELGAWEYWDGRRWVGDHRAAEVVLDGPVGELSVMWSPHLGRWITMYLDEARRAVVLREADDLRGPWGPSEVVVSADEQPALYAPYLLPVGNNGSQVRFMLSRFDLYNVFLFELTLG